MVVFEEDAADAPHVAGVSPTQLWDREQGHTRHTPAQTTHTPTRSGSKSPTQYDLWGSIVARRDDGRVVLVVKRGAAEVDKPHRGVLQPPLTAILWGDGESDLFRQQRGGHLTGPAVIND